MVSMDWYYLPCYSVSMQVLAGMHGQRQGGDNTVLNWLELTVAQAATTFNYSLPNPYVFVGKQRTLVWP